MSAWKIALYSALILTALWFLSPSRSQQAPEPGVVEITYVGRGGGPVSGALDDAIREFEQESREAHAKDPSKPIYHVVSGQNASRGQTEDPTRFLVSVAGGMPPDVILFDRYAVTEWAARGAFYPLDGFLAKDRASGDPDAIRAEDFFDSCWNEVVYRDPLTGNTGVYGVPEKVDNRAFFYNKDLLKRAGYVDEKGEARPPKTWEELQEMAVKLTERDSEGHVARMGFVPNFGNSWLYIYGWMNGGHFMSADGKRCTLNDPRIIGALAWMTKMYDLLGGAEEVYAFQSGFQGADLDPFITGKIAMKIDGFWMITDSVAQFGRNVNYGISRPPIPAAELDSGSKTCSWVSGWCYAIPSTAKNKEAGWQLIHFLCSQRAQEIMAESQRLTLASQGQVFVPTQNANKKINQWLFDKYVINNPSMDPKVAAAVKVFNDLLEGQPYRPVTPVGQMLWNQQLSATENAIFHKLSPQEALDQATMLVQRDLDHVLNPPRGTPVHWGYFFVLYGLLLMAAAVGVFYWDTSARVRQGIGRALGPMGTRLARRSGDVEGVQSSYFRSQWKGGWLCALPWIIGFVVFTGGPILFSIIISFCEFDILNPARFTRLTNYEWMFTKDPLFWKSMWNTVYMMIGIPLGMALSLGIALLLNLKIRGVAVWRTLFYLPSIVPAVASIILWIWILNPQAGFLNQVLASFNEPLNWLYSHALFFLPHWLQLHFPTPNWLQDEHWSKPALILMGLWGAGGGMIIWLAGLKGISESYYEAAALDGASSWQQFVYVTLPLLSPYIFFNLIMGLIGAFQIFTQAFIATQGGPVNSTLFYALHLFNNAFRYLHMGYAASMAWVLFVILFCLTIFQMKLSERWVHYEAE
jgi:ABC-type sugar transport system permease subunit/ABC-type glycerol-3-phosphate transport system substrate-binding protein